MTKIFLQVPEGLKRKALEIAEKLEGAVVICSEPCYGACDIKEKEAKALGCEKIIHYGHTKFIDIDIPVEYVEMREDIDVSDVLDKNFEKLEKFNNIGLVSSLQFLNSLEYAKKFLEEKGKKVFIGDTEHGQKKLYPGQILGCDTSNAKVIEDKVDCFLFIGSGKFHALGIKGKVFVLDVERNEVNELDNELFEKQKYAAIGLAKQANKFGILISTKLGQMNIELAEKIKKELEGKGKKAYFLVMDEINPEKLIGLDLDCYISTACPRIAIDDRTRFEKPILNWDEYLKE